MSAQKAATVTRGVPERFKNRKTLEELQQETGITGETPVEAVINSEMQDMREREELEGFIDADEELQDGEVLQSLDIEDLKDSNPEVIEDEPINIQDDNEAVIRDRIRKQEKEKHRKTIESQKKKIAELEKENQELRESLAERRTGTKKPIVEIPPSSSEKQLRRELDDLRKVVVDLTEERAMLVLESYRDNLIKENEGKIIPEMVTGSSIEELDVSLEAAKVAWENNVAKYARSTPNVSKLGGGGPEFRRSNSPITTNRNQTLREKQIRYRNDPAYRKELADRASADIEREYKK